MLLFRRHSLALRPQVITDERLAKRFPGRIVTHTRIGVWDYYEEKVASPRRWESPLSSMAKRWLEAKENAPYLVQMVKDVMHIPGCMLYLGVHLVAQVSAGIVPALSLWYEGQLIRMLDVVLEEGTVDTDRLLYICTGRLACTVAEYVLLGISRRAQQALGSRIRRYLTLHSFRAYARLDLPTFQDIAVKSKLMAAASDQFGITPISQMINIVIGLVKQYTQLGSQAYVLVNTLKSHRERLIIPLLTLAVEALPTFYRYQWMFSNAKMFAVTSKDKDYLKMQGWKAIVQTDKHRKELVAGNLAELAVSEFSSATERVGDKAIDWNELGVGMNRRDPFDSLIGQIFSQLPQIAFTIQAVKDPRRLPGAFASLSLIQSAAKTFTSSVFQLVAGGNSIGVQLATLRDLYEVRNIPNKVPDGHMPFPESPHAVQSGIALEFRNVSFKYPGSEQYALRNVSFQLLPGQLCVIVGSNGAGKSTILKLAVRLYDPEEGEILLGGYDIRTLKLRDLRGAISVLFQDYTHFPLSIRDNIALGDPSGRASDDDVRAAARLGGAESFIDKLPEGIDTYLNPHVMSQSSGLAARSNAALDGSAVRAAAGLTSERKLELSGGQMQRLAVARTFMRSIVREDTGTGLLLFDEPSASLDPKAEYELFERLRELRGNKTMVFSSHRFGNLTRHADLILYMNESGIVEAGTHEGLLKTGGEYANLWTMQAQAFL